MSSRTMALYTAVGMKGSSGEFGGAWIMPLCKRTWQPLILHPLFPLPPKGPHFPPARSPCPRSLFWDPAAGGGCSVWNPSQIYAGCIKCAVTQDYTRCKKLLKILPCSFILFLFSFCMCNNQQTKTGMTGNHAVTSILLLWEGKLV